MKNDCAPAAFNELQYCFRIIPLYQPHAVNHRAYGGRYGLALFLFLVKNPNRILNKILIFYLSIADLKFTSWVRV